MKMSPVWQRKMSWWWLLLLVYVALELPKPSLCEVSPGDQAKVDVSLKGIQVLVDESHKYLQLKLESLQELQENIVILNKLDSVINNADLNAKINNFRTAVSSISVLMTTASAFVAIFSIVSTFEMPSQLDVIQENFDKVNTKLGGISTQMNNMEDRLKKSIEFNSWFSEYINSELDIRNGDIMMNEMKNRLRVTDNKQEKIKLQEAFVKYYENQNIEGEANKIHYLTALHTTTTKNLFDAFASEHNCDIVQLSKFMSILQDIMISAAKQSAVYELLKTGQKDSVQDKITQYYDKLYEIRRGFDLQVWYCIQSYDKTVRAQVNNVIRNNNRSPKAYLSKKLHKEISLKLPWYEWAVGMTYKTDPIDELSYVCSPRHIRGQEQFIKMRNIGGDQGMNVVLTFQKNDDTRYGCRDLDDSRVFVPFELCDSCSSEVITASKQIITGKECKQQYIDQHYESNCNFLYRETDTFLAAAFGRIENKCSGNNVCNNNGICEQIPYSNEIICQCFAYYEGKECEKYINPIAENEVLQMIVSLRNDLVTHSAVPAAETLNDVKNLRQRITASNKFCPLISYFDKDLRDAGYIKENYEMFQSNVIDGKTFSRILSSSDLRRTLHGIKNAIQGIYISETEDYLTLYKKTLVGDQDSDQVCSLIYSELVTATRDNLLSLDETLTQVNVWMLQRELEKPTFIGRDHDIANKIKAVQEASQVRQGDYSRLWTETSCPKLNVTDLKEQFCEAYHSYEGLSVTLSCSNQKHPHPSSVHCERTTNGQLNWSETPECRYDWSVWSTWGSCSATCGTGARTRRRSKSNGEEETEQSQCNTQDCCQELYGKFKCPNGNCRMKGVKCDGKNDCGDWSDESDCSYLRVGDTIALKSNYANRFLGCGDSWCMINDCLGLDTDSSDWTTCQEQSCNRIEVAGKPNGAIIRHGDSVSLRWRSSGHYFYCQYSYIGHCGTKGSSPSEDAVFKIYSERRRGNCGEDISKHCIGEPLKSKDMVFLEFAFGKFLDYYGYRGWVGIHGSSRHKSRLGSCSKNQPKNAGCPRERWILYVK